MINIKDLKIESQVVHFDVIAKQPTTEEAISLSKITVDKEKLRRNSKRSAKKKSNALWGNIGKAFLILLGGGFGFLMLTTGTIESGSAMRGIVWLVVIATPIAAVIYIVKGIVQLFGSANTKTPEKVYTVWERLVFGNSTSDEFHFFDKTKCNQPEKRAEELIDIIPEDVDTEKVSQYIYNTWQTLTNVINEITLRVMQETGLAKAFTSIERITEPADSLYENVKIIKSTIIITDNIKYESKTNINDNRYYEPIIVKLHVTQYLVKSDEHWYPYDITPTMRRNNEIIQD